MIPQVDLFLFVFLGEFEDTKKTFRNYVTFGKNNSMKNGGLACEISDVCFLSAHFTLLLLPLRWIKRRMIFWTMSKKEQATSTQINGLTTRPRRPNIWVKFISGGSLIHLFVCVDAFIDG